MGGRRESPSFAEDDRGRQRQRLGDILVSPDGNGEDWLTLTAQAPFGQRDSFGEVVHHGRIYVIGGWAEGNRDREVWSSDDGLTWQLETNTPDFADTYGGGRGQFSALSHNGSIYVIAGQEDGNAKNDVWSSADGREWMLVTDDAGFAERSSYAAVVHNGVMFVIGGEDYEEGGSYPEYNDVWASADGAKWTMLSSPFGEAIYHAKAVSYQGKIIMMGGANQSKNFSSVWSSADGVEWELVSDKKMLSRFAHSAVVYGDKIFVMGNRYYAEGPLTQRRVVESSSDGGETWVTRDKYWDYSDTGDNSPWRRSYGGAVAFSPEYSASGPLSGAVEMVRDTFYTGLGDTGLVGKIKVNGGGTTQYTFSLLSGDDFELASDGLVFLSQEQTSAGALNAVVRVSGGSEFLDLTVAVQVRAPAEEMIFAMGGYAEASSFEEDSRGRRRQYHSDILVSPDGNGEDWITLRADVPFSERAFFGEVVHNGRIYILGGWAYDGQRSPEIWSSANGLTWKLEATNPDFGPDGIGGLLALSHNGSIYVIGGEGDSGGYQNDVWSSADGREWMLVTDNARFAERAYFSGVVHNGTMFVFGGEYYDAEEDSYIFYNDVWASTDGANWMKLSSPFGQGNCCQAAVSYNGNIVVMGGYYEDTGRYSSAVWSSADGIKWDLVSNGAMLGRYGHSAAVYNSKIFVMGNRYFADGSPTQRRVVESSSDGGKTWVTRDKWWDYSDTGNNSPWRRSYGGAVTFSP